MTLSDAQAKGLKDVNSRTRVGQPALVGVCIAVATAKALASRGLVRLSGRYVHMTEAGRAALESR